MDSNPGEEVILGVAEPAYPALLRAISDPPPRLYVRTGSPLAWARLSADPIAAIAIVGARDSTPYGEKLAFEIARDLSAAGVLVVSGLARGIDAAAHAGCIAGGASTVAVVGAGTEHPYPIENAALRGRILASGLVVGEHPAGTAPRAGYFPRRNRIISGLSHGVLVVEAGLRSGSLVTARLARDQGRAVLAVPGRVDHPRSRGPHALLREGARLVESARDVFDEIPWLAGVAARWARRDEVQPRGADHAPGQAPGIPPAEAILAALAGGGRAPDHLAVVTGVKPEEIWACLLDLELRGRVVRGVGGRFSLAP